MDKAECPLLGTMDEANKQQVGIDYPSFENRCFADPAHVHTPLMLADQATYCLSGSHQVCPRFRVAQMGSLSRSTPLELHEDSAPFSAFPTWDRNRGSASLHGPSSWEPAQDPDWTAEMLAEPTGASRSPLWMGAVAIFAFVFLCGIGMALYTGWQLVSSNLLAAQPDPGTVTTLALQQAIPAPAELYIVMTATSPAQLAPAQGPPTVGAVLIEPTPTFVFPAAVTATPSNDGSTSGNAEATPIVVNPAVSQPADSESPASETAGDSAPAQQNDVATQPIAPDPRSVPVILPPTPTPRPTPVFDLPLNAPIPAVATETPTPTPTITYGPPFIIFKADDSELNTGDCTIVRWEVKNVAAVYYEDRGVFGKGEDEVCMSDKDKVYDLVVFLPDGSSQVYTTTIALILPTATPEPTETFTPEPLPSPTWTPQPPTATPTPNVSRGVTLAIDGATERICASGEVCEFGLLATNTGDANDNLAIVLSRSDAFSPQLCRQDGVCASQRIEFINVGPALTAFVTVRVSIPADAEEGTVRYAFRVVSVLSGEQTFSDDVQISITIQ